MHYPPVPYPPNTADVDLGEHPDAGLASCESASSSSPPAPKSTQDDPMPRPRSPRTARSPFKRPAPTSSPSHDARLGSTPSAHARSASPTPHRAAEFTWSQPVAPSKRARAPAGFPFKAPKSARSPVGERSSKRRKGAVEEDPTKMLSADPRSTRSLATPTRSSSTTSSSTSPSSSPSTSPFPTSRPFPTPTRTTSALVADYRAALADEATFRGITEAELRESLARRDEDEGEDELRPLDVELRERGWGAPREGGGSRRERLSMRSTVGGGGGAARSPSPPPASTSSHPTKRSRAAAAAASTLRKAFRAPRPVERAPSPPSGEDDDDELLVALDRAIAASSVRSGSGTARRGGSGASTGAGAAAAGGAAGRAGASGALAPGRAGS
ncbi:hypothetical protein JCM3775_001523 [Rhodotorula graminis]